MWSNAATRTSSPAHRARRARVLARDGHACQLRLPGCAGHATVCDHVVNLAAGGTDSDDNCQAVCGPCHKQKVNLEAIAGRARYSAKRPVPAHPGVAGG